MEKMNSPIWNACLEYFRHLFPTCKKCQPGHDTVEELMTHLTVSHYRQEALAAFGKGPNCPICATVLIPPNESFRQHYILSHMACHLPVFVPGEAKHFLSIAVPTESLSEEEEKPPSIASLIPRDPEPSLKEENNFDVSDSPLDKSDISQEVQSTNSGLYWQECEDFMKNEFPRCQACQGGFDNMRHLKRHLVLVHYGDEASRHFGSGNECAICQEPPAPPPEREPPSGSRKTTNHLIKIHMVRHLRDILPENARPYFLKALQLQGNIPRSQMARKSAVAKFASLSETRDCKTPANPFWQKCAEFLKKNYPMCKVCQYGFCAPAELKRHFGNIHCGGESLKLFGTGRTCAICKTFKLKRLPKDKQEIFIAKRKMKDHMWREHFELIIPEEAKSCFIIALEQPTRGVFSTYTGTKQGRAERNNLTKRSTQEQQTENFDPDFQKCVEFVRNKFSQCGTCQNGFTSRSKLSDHVVCVHYKDRASKQFGNGLVCSICNNFSVSSSVPGNHKRVIERHMKKKHLGHIFTGEEREIFSKALGFDDNLSSLENVEHHYVEGTKSEMEDASYEVQACSTKGPNLIPVSEWNNNDLAKHDCEQYFQDIYPNCATCQKGHDSLKALKLHLTLSHYGNSAIELFADNSACPICDLLVLPCPEKTAKTIRHKRIKEHMSMHLEEFVVGKAKTLLLRATDENSSDTSWDTKPNQQGLPNYCDTKETQFQDIPSESTPKIQTHPTRNRSSISVQQVQSMDLGNAQPSFMSDPLWQDCEAYFKEKYPSCKTCSAGFKTSMLMRRHLVNMHYREMAFKLFGKNDCCSICNNYSVPPTSDIHLRSNLIKMHMSTHLELFITDEQAKSLLMRAREKWNKSHGKNMTPLNNPKTSTPKGNIFPELFQSSPSEPRSEDVTMEQVSEGFNSTRVPNETVDSEGTAFIKYSQGSPPGNNIWASAIQLAERDKQTNSCSGNQQVAMKQEAGWRQGNQVEFDDDNKENIEENDNDEYANFMFANEHVEKTMWVEEDDGIQAKY